MWRMRTVTTPEMELRGHRRLRALGAHLGGAAAGGGGPHTAVTAVDAAASVVTAIETVRCGRLPSLLWVRIETSTGQVCRRPREPFHCVCVRVFCRFEFESVPWFVLLRALNIVVLTAVRFPAQHLRVLCSCALCMRAGGHAGCPSCCRPLHQSGPTVYIQRVQRTCTLEIPTHFVSLCTPPVTAHCPLWLTPLSGLTAHIRYTYI